MVFFNKTKESEVPGKSNSGKLVFFLFLFVSFTTVITNFFKEESALSVNIHLSVRNNLWSHYGIKSLKGKLYELEKNNFIFASQTINEPSQEGVSRTLIDNLDHEISRYKKEQNDIQSNALNADTKYELARRRYLVFLVSFSLCLLSFILCSYLLFFQLNKDSLLLSSEQTNSGTFRNILGNSIIVLNIISLGFLIYGFWLAL